VKLSIITPCRNAIASLEETMDSILNQRAVLSGRVELEYVIVDGASDDGTQDLARRSGVRVLSEKDAGLYDAVAKGMLTTTGDVVAYCNAGDTYHAGAFDVVAELFQRPEIQWLTGFRVGMNEASQVTDVRLQRPFRRAFFENGIYAGGPLPTVQQESTFWRRSLHDSVDLKKLRSFRLAGDFYLWQCFSSVAQVTTVDAFLGAHRIHRGQLSENQSAYHQEVHSICRKATWRERITARWDAGDRGVIARAGNAMFGLPPMGGAGFFFDHSKQAWRVFD